MRTPPKGGSARGTTRSLSGRAFAYGAPVRPSGTPAWAGYTYAGDFAVYVSHGDRDVVRKILGSAH